MTAYTIHREYVSGRDGDKGFAAMADAERDFDDACADPSVVSAELIDNSGDQPVIVKAH